MKGRSATTGVIEIRMSVMMLGRFHICPAP
jgi:hypothetical protein